jgi:hypothetical protein
LDEWYAPKEITFFKSMFSEILTLFTAPLHEEEFDFGADDFWNEIGTLGEWFAKDTELRKMIDNRGSKHFLYMNRIFFGLFNLLHDLKQRCW